LPSLFLLFFPRFFVAFFCATSPPLTLNISSLQSTRALSLALLQQLSVQTTFPAEASSASRPKEDIGFLLEVASKRGKKGALAAIAH
jgi:hypothetical protein